ILIGDRAGLDPALEARLQAAGTYHVIAISGGNIAVLAGLCVVVLRASRCPPRLASAATMALIAGYGWMVGGEPSVVRATTAACVYLAASMAGLAPAALEILVVTALLVVIVDPLMVVDVGA